MNKIELERRSADMYTGKEDLEPLYTFPDFPVYCGVSEDPLETDICADMKWMISQGSGMIQLGGLVPAELLYSKSHNASIGGVWQKHHEKFADFLHEFASGGIVEIGGGNGILNAIYTEKYQANDDWVIIDPTSVELARGVSARYICKMWDENINFEEAGIDCGTLVHSHLMEHQYDLRAFMQLNADRLEIGHRMVFTLPNLKEWLKRKYSNALFFEHTYLITEDYIDAILQEYGFKILAKEYFGDGHSIFYATEKTLGGGLKGKIDCKALYDENARMFWDYVEHNRAIVEKANRFIEESQAGVWLFGAHIFSQYLIQNGLRADRIKGILDNDELKQGKRLYGTALKVYSPKILGNEESPRLILNAGAYTEEIKDDILRNINQETVILE